MKDQLLKPMFKGNNMLPSHLTPISTWVAKRCIFEEGNYMSLEDMYNDYVQACEPDLEEEYTHMNIIIFKWALLATEHQSSNRIKLWKKQTDRGTCIYTNDVRLGDNVNWVDENDLLKYTSTIPENIKGNGLDPNVMETYWKGRTEHSDFAHITSWQLLHDFEEWYGQPVQMDALKRALNTSIKDYKYNGTTGISNRKFRDCEF
jgi:hypothetical protein